MHPPQDGLILAAGLTPAWQQTVCLPKLEIGHVNRARTAHWCASGKVVNVGLALHYLGGASKTLAPIGGGSGSEISADLAALGASARWVRTQASTRVCTTIIDESARVITELVENAGPLEAEDVASFIQAYREEAASASLIVLTGSLPQGVDRGFYRELLRHSTAPAILDVRGEELLAALELQPLLVKPNREELEQTLGRKLASDRELLVAMRELNQRGAQWVLVTQGAGLVWLTSKADTLRIQPTKIQVVNSTGCGDCLTAGIAWSLRNGCEMTQAVQFGLAAAAVNAESLLPGRIDASQVAARTQGLTMEKIE
ncbi:MAG: hexose kinase [Planctomycetes bacterium]|nr:hexose kinase [Planctomycetota bacterium]